MLYLFCSILVIILVILYFTLKCHLKKFIRDSAIDVKSVNNNSFPPGMALTLNRNRLSFVRTISGGLSSYLFAPFIAFIPHHFNYICTMAGLEWDIHVLSWCILSGLFLGLLHFGIYVCGISIVRYSWSSCCKHSSSQTKNNFANLNRYRFDK